MIRQLFVPKFWNFLFIDSNSDNKSKLYNNHDPSKFIYSNEQNFRLIRTLVGFEYFVNRNWLHNSVKFISFGDLLLKNSRDGDESFEYILQCVDKLATTNPFPNELTVVYHGENLHKKETIENRLEPIKDCLFFEKRSIVEPIE